MWNIQNVSCKSSKNSELNVYQLYCWVFTCWFSFCLFSSKLNHTTVIVHKYKPSIGSWVYKNSNCYLMLFCVAYIWCLYVYVKCLCEIIYIPHFLLFYATKKNHPLPTKVFKFITKKNSYFIVQKFKLPFLRNYTKANKNYLFVPVRISKICNIQLTDMVDIL